MASLPDTLHALLAHLRGSRTVDAVAKECGFSKSMVYGWEADPATEKHYRRITAANLQTLLDHYAVDTGARAKAWVLLAKAPASTNPPREESTDGDEPAERVA